MSDERLYSALQLEIECLEETLASFEHAPVRTDEAIALLKALERDMRQLLRAA